MRRARALWEFPETLFPESFRMPINFKIISKLTQGFFFFLNLRAHSPLPIPSPLHRNWTNSLLLFLSWTQQSRSPCPLLQVQREGGAVRPPLPREVHSPLQWLKSHLHKAYFSVSPAWIDFCTDFKDF